MLKSIKLTNLLSFGPNSEPLELGPLNVLIGANGSGKSNLIEAISLLQAAPRNLTKPIVEGGGLREWLWKGAEGTPVATIEVGIEYPDRAHVNEAGKLLRYKLSFTDVQQQIEVVDEHLVENSTGNGQHQLVPYFTHKGTDININLSENISMQPSESNGSYARESALSLYKGPTFESPSISVFLAPTINFASQQLDAIRIYRNWRFAPNEDPRRLLPVEAQGDFLNEDASNLIAVLNILLKNNKVKKQLIRYLNDFYRFAENIRVSPFRHYLELRVKDGDFFTPAARLSEGTLRWLALLTILLHPTPPPLVCIEEPENNLHHDVIPTLAELLRNASERTQLIITTHSTALVDEFSDTPEVVVVCDKEKLNGSTRMRRLDREDLKEWLKDEGLGLIWASGEIGGNRW